MTRRDIPNLISLFRILLVAPLVWAMLGQHYHWVVLLFVVGGLSDALDGYLARRNGWTSRLGSILDPLGDKLMLAAVFLVLGWQGHLPLWLVALIIGRDVVIIAGAIAYHFVVHRYEMAPSRVSKLNTVLQIGLAAAVVVSLALGPLPQAISMALVWLVAATTLLSGLDYIWVWGRRACELRCGGDDE